MSESIPVTTDLAGQTLAAVLKRHQPGRSWKDVRQLVAERRAKVNGELCLDPARRLKAGDAVEMLGKPAPLPRAVADEIVIRHLDDHVVVVEKPSGINTVRHPAEREWAEDRRELSPTLEDRTQQAVAARLRRPPSSLARLRIVHRLDKLTSGLVVFARTVPAERGLGKQFHAHTVTRRYLAIVHGTMTARTIRSRLVRDRGDGRRGSTDDPTAGKEAVTHVEPVERVGVFTLVSCRLETGRTHQIRIHLSEADRPVCGEPVYQREPDRTGAPRLALHATELGFRHPVTGEALHWEMPLPADLAEFLARLRAGPTA